MAKPIVEVRGVRELNRALRRLDAEAPRRLRDVFMALAARAVGPIAGALPRRTGRLAASVRSGATRRAALVRIGRASVPYAGPVEFGGWPRGRAYVPQGRYIFPAARALDGQSADAASRAIDKLIREIGL